MAGTYVAVALRNDKGEWLVLEEGKGGSHPWRFPGGKPEPNERPITTAVRELEEEIQVKARSLEYVYTFTNVVDGNTWTGEFYVCDCYFGEPNIPEAELKKHPSFKWVTTWDLFLLQARPEFEAAVKILLEETGRK